MTENREGGDTFFFCWVCSAKCRLRAGEHCLPVRDKDDVSCRQGDAFGRSKHLPTATMTKHRKMKCYNECNEGPLGLMNNSVLWRVKTGDCTNRDTSVLSAAKPPPFTQWRQKLIPFIPVSFTKAVLLLHKLPLFLIKFLFLWLLLSQTAIFLAGKRVNYVLLCSYTRNHGGCYGKGKYFAYAVT